MPKGEERIIEIPGLSIAALEWGPKDGIPVLALHGWVDNAESFSFLAPLLENMHVIAIDSPGCGNSSHKAKEGFPSIIEEAFYVMQVADALGFDKFVLLSHSRGATVAQLVASGCPERILSLILIDNVGLFPRPVLPLWRKAMASVIKNKPRAATLYKDLEDAIRGRMLAGTIAYESAKALTLRGSKKVEGGYKWTFDRREMLFVNPLAMSADQAQELLEGIESPTCVILGEDGIISPDNRENYAKPIEGHELHVIAGHHHLHMDDPEPVAKIINEFVQRKLLA